MSSRSASTASPLASASFALPSGPAGTIPALPWPPRNVIRFIGVSCPSPPGASATARTLRDAGIIAGILADCARQLPAGERITLYYTPFAATLEIFSGYSPMLQQYRAYSGDERSFRATIAQSVRWMEDAPAGAASRAGHGTTLMCVPTMCRFAAGPKELHAVRRPNNRQMKRQGRRQHLPPTY